VLVAVTHSGAVVTGVRVLSQDTTTTTEATTSEKKAPNPILPVWKEVFWGFGSFIVLLVVVRFALFPRMKKGMEARYESIRSNIESAEATRAAAEGEIADYQAELARIRIEGNQRVDAARRDLEAQRATRLEEVNAHIRTQRARAAAENETAKAAALSNVEETVTEVATSGAERVLGRPVDRDGARSIVRDVLSASAGAIR
jgi:F-type H+-transporting ATPase subunit b